MSLGTLYFNLLNLSISPRGGEMADSGDGIPVSVCNEPTLNKAQRQLKGYCTDIRQPGSSVYIKSNLCALPENFSPV